MPRDLIFIRHGQSEANVLQQAEKDGRVADLPEEVRTRPDWEHRLTHFGAGEAEVTSGWMSENECGVETFDVRYCSPFIRARETAVHLGGSALEWRKHSMLHERDWGHFGTTPRDQRAELYPRTHQLKRTAPLYARLDGGEALADTVTLRVREFREEVKRKWDGKRVLAVTHGDVMQVARFVFEDLLPEELHENYRDPAQDIGNCALLWYKSVNPEDPSDVRPYLGWRRMVQPNDLSKSPFNGEWQELPDNRFMTGADMLASVEQVPRLFPDAVDLRTEP